MTTAVLIAIIGLASGAVGVASGLITARYTWRKDRREGNEADDVASDRIIGLLKQANELAIQNERLKYEQKLNDELDKINAHHRQQMNDMRVSLLAEMQRQIREALDEYGCENAANKCPNRRPRIHAIPLGMSPGGTI